MSLPSKFFTFYSLIHSFNSTFNEHLVCTSARSWRDRDEQVKVPDGQKFHLLSPSLPSLGYK